MKSSLLLFERLFGQIRQRLLCCDGGATSLFPPFIAISRSPLSLVFAAYFLFWKESKAGTRQARQGQALIRGGTSLNFSSLSRAEPGSFRARAWSSLASLELEPNRAEPDCNTNKYIFQKRKKAIFFQLYSTLFPKPL